MSQIEHHHEEVSRIETELMRHMITLGLDWHNESSMARLADEFKDFGAGKAQAAYCSQDLHQISKAEFFGLTSIMLKTMGNAALENRVVHGGEVWKAFGKHLYPEHASNRPSVDPIGTRRNDGAMTALPANDPG